MHHVDLRVEGVVAVALERNQSGGGPTGLCVPGWIVRQARRGRAVGAHHVNLAVAIPVAPERDPSPVGRPTGITVEGRIVREPRWSRTVGAHYVDLRVAIPGAHERNLTPIGRPTGLPVVRRIVRELRLP